MGQLGRSRRRRSVYVVGDKQTFQWDILRNQNIALWSNRILCILSLVGYKVIHIFLNLKHPSFNYRNSYSTVFLHFLSNYVVDQ